MSPKEALIHRNDAQYLYRMRSMHKYASKRVLQKVYLCGIDIIRHQSLFDICQAKNVPLVKFRNSLTSEQIQQVHADPEGHSFDVRLLYHCIKWVSNCTAHRNDQLWQEGNESLESHVTTVIIRNERIFHQDASLDEQRFVSETEDLRILLKDTLRLAALRYNVPEKIATEWITGMNTHVNLLRDRPLPQSDISSLENQMLLLNKQDLLVNMYKPAFNAYFNTHKEKPSPSIHNSGLSFMVDTQYTVLSFGRHSSIRFDDILQDNINQTPNDPIIWLEGFSGMGKTVLLNKLTEDWIRGKSTIQDLMNYDILLFCEGRSNISKTLVDLLITIMPDTTNLFTGNELVQILLSMKVLVIIDGLDEISDSSEHLVQEIMYLKRDYVLTLIVTSRMTYHRKNYQFIESHDFHTKNIYVQGIGASFRSQIVIHCIKELTENRLCDQNIETFMNYLKENEVNLSLDSPYHLMSLIVLWTNNPTSLQAITCPMEFCWQVYVMITDAIMGHLPHYESFQQCTKFQITEKINEFFYVLGEEALTSLLQGDITLSQESYAKLAETCTIHELPINIMTYACLRTRSAQSIISFHNEVFIAFFAALTLSTKLQKSNQYSAADMSNIAVGQPQDIYHELTMSFQEALNKEATKSAQGSADITDEGEMPSNEVVTQETDTYMEASQMLRNCGKKQKCTTIKTILQELNAHIADKGLYENLLIMLIGLLCFQGKQIDDNIKEEALDLLREIGRKKEVWMCILNFAKCDAFVIKYISEQPLVLEGKVIINDYCLHPYNILLQSLKSLPKTGHLPAIYLDLMNDSPLIPVVLGRILDLRLTITHILLNYHFRNPSATFAFGSVMHQVLNRCNVVSYLGPVTSDMYLPSSIAELRARINDRASYAPVERFISMNPRKTIRLCLPPTMDATPLRLLPNKRSEIYIPNATEEEIENVIHIIKKLLPIQGDRKLGGLRFHGILLKAQGLLKLLQGLKDVKVYLVAFPDTPEPTSHTAEFEIVKEESEFRIQWKGHLESWI